MRSALVLLAPLGALAEGALLSGGPLSAVVLAGLLGAVTSLVTVALVVAVLVLAGLLSPHPVTRIREAAGTRILVWLRNPDAAGHIRSRAPGRRLRTV